MFRLIYQTLSQTDDGGVPGTSTIHVIFFNHKKRATKVAFYLYSKNYQRTMSNDALHLKDSSQDRRVKFSYE